VFAENIVSSAKMVQAIEKPPKKNILQELFTTLYQLVAKNFAARTPPRVLPGEVLAYSSLYISKIFSGNASTSKNG